MAPVSPLNDTSRSKRGGKAPRPSVVTLPDTAGADETIFSFLRNRFPRLPEDVLRHRIACGEITDEKGAPISLETPFKPSLRLFYFREATDEPVIPFQERIIFEDDHLIAVVKPHFLPVTPSGPYVNECLLYRLIDRTGIHSLSPLHRIDRETAGIVIFSVNQKTRGCYQTLFDTGQIQKTYEALAGPPFHPLETAWEIESRIEKGDPFFRMKETQGAANAKSRIRLIQSMAGLARYEVIPCTGKKHQIRIHMCRISSGIINDRCYPVLEEEKEPDFKNPLKLLAKEIALIDPLTKEKRRFLCEESLWWKPCDHPVQRGPAHE